jgi:uroporphyrin-III C-methyltransferase/precorrin-2 dehydrogenase/sirohydrochlorin ferrochelatase
MGMERLESICARLVAHGRNAATPAAVVHRATLPGQRIVRAPLFELADAARTAGVGAPAVVIIGNVVDVLPALESD